MSHIFILYNKIMFKYQNTSLDRIKSHRFIFKLELCATQHLMTVYKSSFLIIFFYEVNNSCCNYKNYIRWHVTLGMNYTSISYVTNVYTVYMYNILYITALHIYII